MSNPAYIADVLIGAGYVAFRRGELDVAAHVFENAQKTFDQIHDPFRSAAALYNAANMHAALGNHGRATQLLDGAFTRWRDIGEERYYALGLCLRGAIALDSQAYEEASSSLIDARKWGTWTEDLQNTAIATGLMAVIALHENDLRLASRRAAEALETISRAHATDATALFIIVGFLAAGSAGDRESAVKQITFLRENTSPDDRYFRDLLDDAIGICSATPKTHPFRNIYLRLAGRVAYGTRAEAANTEVSITQRELKIAPGGSGFWLDDGEFVDISSRKPLKLLLDGFTQGYIDHPNRGFSVDKLVQIGWPGEVISESAGKNRVYTAIRFLRDCGLEDCIVTSHDGYRFADDLRVMRVSS